MKHKKVFHLECILHQDEALSRNFGYSLLDFQPMCFYGKGIGLNVKFMEAKMIRRKFILDCQNWKIQLSQEYIFSNFGSKLTKWPVRGIGEEKPDRGVRLD
jgi:hypothetical protein